MDNKVKSDKRTAGPFYTLEERYPIRYRRPLRVPVQLLITGNKLKIRFYVRYAKNMMNLFPGTNLTYADIAEAGIRANWSRRYAFPWLRDDGFERAHAKASVRILDNNEDPSDIEIAPLDPTVRVFVEFVRYGSPAARSESPKQRYFRVRLSEGILYPAHVVSPVWRWYWGFFRSYQFESLHLNWSRRQPGNVTFQKAKDRHTYQQICAHEFGHILGLGDAYGASYRFFYEAPGTGSYMMCHNRTVQPEELEMVMKAHITNRMQYFPRKFQRSVYFSGIRRTVQLQFTASVKDTVKHR